MQDLGEGSLSGSFVRGGDWLELVGIEGVRFLFVEVGFGRESKLEIEKLLAKIRGSYAPTSEVEMLFLKLVSQLKTCKGRKQYGYLPKEVKDTVNRIVAELAKGESIAKLNLEWNKVNREKLSLSHEKNKPGIPLKDNPEFRSIKNVIVRSAVLAMRIMDAEHSQTYDVGSAMKSVVSALCKIISKRYDKKIARLNTQIDSKLSRRRRRMG